MNKELASLLFYNETLYVNPEKDISAPTGIFTTDKHVLVLSTELSSKESVFIEKILKSVKLSKENVAFHYKQIDLSEIVALENVKYVLVFGEMISNSTLTVGLYQSALLDRKIFIFADPLAMIEKNLTGEKIKLWNVLKEIFFS